MLSSHISLHLQPQPSHFSSSKHCSKSLCEWLHLVTAAIRAQATTCKRTIPAPCPVLCGSSRRAPARGCEVQQLLGYLSCGVSSSSQERTGMGSWTWESCCTEVCGRDTQMANDAVRTHLKSCIRGLLLTTHRVFSRERQWLVHLNQKGAQESCATLSSHSSSSEHASPCTKARAHTWWLPQDPQLCPVLQTQHFGLLVTVWSVITDIISVVFEQILKAQTFKLWLEPAISFSCSLREAWPLSILISPGGPFPVPPPCLAQPGVCLPCCDTNARNKCLQLLPHRDYLPLILSLILSQSKSICFSQKQMGHWSHLSSLQLWLKLKWQKKG